MMRRRFVVCKRKGGWRVDLSWRQSQVCPAFTVSSKEDRWQNLGMIRSDHRRTGNYTTTRLCFQLRSRGIGTLCGLLLVFRFGPHDVDGGDFEVRLDVRRTANGRTAPCMLLQKPTPRLPCTLISRIVCPLPSSSTMVTSRNWRRRASSGRRPVLAENSTLRCCGHAAALAWRYGQSGIRFLIADGVRAGPTALGARRRRFMVGSQTVQGRREAGLEC